MSRSSEPNSGGKKQARRTKRTFNTEFKEHAVELMRRRRAQGISLSQIGRELDVAPTLLWEWQRKLDGKMTGAAVEPGGSSAETLEEEVKRLRREVIVLRQEREFAKKAAAFFMKESL